MNWSVPLARALRYRNLEREAERLCASRIMEIGTCKGDTAEAIIRAAQRGGANVYYYGFDLFAPAPDHELSGRKIAADIETVRARLEATGARVELFAGDTHGTLPAVAPCLEPMDLIFIDGGHSAETVESDWSHARSLMHETSVAIFDDYWNLSEGGCNRTVDRLLADPEWRVVLLDPVDRFRRPWGELRTQLAKVKRL